MSPLFLIESRIHSLPALRSLEARIAQSLHLAQRHHSSWEQIEISSLTVLGYTKSKINQSIDQQWTRYHDYQIMETRLSIIRSFQLEIAQE